MDTGFGSNSVVTPHHNDFKNKEPYSQLIYRALMSTDQHAMTLQDIYAWFRNNTDKDKAKKDSQGWKNSIRHNLSMNAAFQKRERKSSKADIYKSSATIVPTSISTSTPKVQKVTEWFLEPWAIHGGLQSTTRYRKRNLPNSHSRGSSNVCHPSGHQWIDRSGPKHAYVLYDYSGSASSGHKGVLVTGRHRFEQASLTSTAYPMPVSAGISYPINTTDSGSYYPRSSIFDHSSVCTTESALSARDPSDPSEGCRDREVLLRGGEAIQQSMDPMLFQSNPRTYLKLRTYTLSGDQGLLGRDDLGEYDFFCSGDFDGLSCPISTDRDLLGLGWQDGVLRCVSH